MKTIVLDAAWEAVAPDSPEERRQFLLLLSGLGLGGPTFSLPPPLAGHVELAGDAEWDDVTGALPMTLVGLVAEVPIWFWLVRPAGSSAPLLYGRWSRTPYWTDEAERNCWPPVNGGAVRL